MSNTEPSNLAKRPWFEPATVILMGLATLCTAWSSFENSRWSSLARGFKEQSDALSREALALHVESLQVKMVHYQIFSDLVNAELEGDLKRYDFYSKRLIDELKPAFEAWLAKRPFENAATSGHPFTEEYYKPRNQEKIAITRTQTEKANKESDIASDHASDHLSNTVIFSAVLFFAGTARTFDRRRVRTVVLWFAFTLFAFSAIRMLFLPVA